MMKLRLGHDERQGRSSLLSGIRFAEIRTVPSGEDYTIGACLGNSLFNIERISGVTGNDGVTERLVRTGQL
jgi:hypothetical protein